MERLIQTQTAPDQTACPTVLIEGRPVVVLDTAADGDALPHVLVGGRPVTVVSPDRPGSVSVLGGLASGDESR